jgi:prepilin peptidase CpaA
MSYSSLPIWCAALTTALVGTAMITDLRWRRIPNVLTFGAFGSALAIRIAFQGWAGLGLALGGAFLAPLLLLAMHGGKGLGMGDLKLAGAVGAIFGPVLAITMILISAVAGGVMAVTILTMRGGGLAQLFSTFLIGLPFTRKWRANGPAVDDHAMVVTMPYGIAIGVGSLITMAVCWWTGQEAWFLSFVGIAGSR